MIEQANPIDALMSMQKPDGSIGGSYANAYSTADALIGLSGVPLSNAGISPVSNQAGVAVFFGDGTVVTGCVSFSESNLTGLELLQRSGLNIEIATNPNQGTAVCKIGDVGNPSGDCFGSMPNYWSYWQLDGAGWAYAVVGADQSQVENGDVNAWDWGEGDAPVLISYQNICEAVPFVMPDATQTPNPPTELPQPTVADTTVPTLTQPQPTATAEVPRTNPGTYIVYGSIIVVLGALIYFVVHSRRNKQEN
jgi:cell division septation protein DedD